MNMKEYQAFTRTTNKYPPEYMLQCLMCGLCEEVAEYCEAVNNFDSENIVKELGDCFWYVSEIANFYGWEMQDMFSGKEAENINRMMITAGKLAGQVKKIFRDGMTTDRKDKIFDMSMALADAVAFQCELQDIEIGLVLSMNRLKLSGRVERGTIHGEGDDR